jgi:hypothetical protein
MNPIQEAICTIQTRGKLNVFSAQEAVEAIQELNKEIAEIGEFLSQFSPAAHIHPDFLETSAERIKELRREVHYYEALLYATYRDEPGTFYKYFHEAHGDESRTLIYISAW